MKLQPWKQPSSYSLPWEPQLTDTWVYLYITWWGVEAQRWTKEYQVELSWASIQVTCRGWVSSLAQQFCKAASWSLQTCANTIPSDVSGGNKCCDNSHAKQISICVPFTLSTCFMTSYIISCNLSLSTCFMTSYIISCNLSYIKYSKELFSCCHTSKYDTSQMMVQHTECFELTSVISSRNMAEARTSDVEVTLVFGNIY
jgi:hypothetical protein